MPEMSEAVAARQALSPNGDGFVWRAIDSRTGDVTEWNISWVDEDEASGWIRMSISGGLTLTTAPIFHMESTIMELHGIVNQFQPH